MKNDGGSAYPILPPVDETGRTAVGYPYPEIGMRLRDYFAAQIACGMSAFSGTAGLGYGPGEIAVRSYQIADAMLKAREASDEIG